MPMPDYTEHTFGSTTWEWKRIKVRRPAGGQDDGAEHRKGFHGLPTKDWRKPTTLTIKYRGGPECWVEVHARGRIWRRPGNVAIIDMLRDITQNV